jgi:hypothetical protein
MFSSLSNQLLSPWLYTFRRYQRQWSARSRSQAWIAVLCYQRIVAKPADKQSDLAREANLSAATFEAQMRFMRKHFMPIHAQQVPAYQSRPGCYFAVMFDEVHLDNFTVATPILRQLGLSATFLVSHQYPTTETAPDKQHLISMAQLRQLQQQGFDIGLQLAGASPTLNVIEATTPFHALEKPLQCLAYADPQWANRREEFRQCGLQAAFTNDSRLITKDDDAFALPRITLKQPYAFACAYQIEQAFQNTIRVHT